MTRWIIGRWWRSALCFFGFHESDGLHQIEHGWARESKDLIYTRCSWCRKKMNGSER